nr:HD domain-containing protein [Pyrolobus fumarii]
MPLDTDFKIVKDPVHTSIVLPSDFFKLIDDPLFQRLRYIKQTGLSHYVYPGLQHTRFEHSLGVAHLMLTALDAIVRNTLRIYGEGSEAAQLAKRLVESREYRCAAGIAALLHDLGHLAWSHVFETALQDYEVVSSAHGPESLSIPVTGHEQLTTMLVNLLLAKQDTLCGLHAHTVLDLVTSILEYSYGDSKEVKDEALWIPARLLSGTVDVDRGDYLLRDSRSAGVSYGLYDLDRLISVLVLAWEPPTELPGGAHSDVGVIDKGVSVVENMLLGRMYMYSEVYLHDVVLAYEAGASRLLSTLMLAALQLYERSFEGVEGFERRLLECIVDTLVNYSELEENRPERLEQCARLLTDPSIELVTELLAFNESSIYEGLKKLEDGRWACPALRIYSRVLTARKHPPSLYLSGKKANIIVSRMTRRSRRVSLPAIKRMLQPYFEALENTPLIIVTYTVYPVYSRDEPVLVVHRENKRVYTLHELDTSPIGELLSSGGIRSKVVVTFPPLPELPELPHPAFRARAGKLESKVVEHAYRACGYSDDETRNVLRQATRMVVDIAEEIGSLVTTL